jgi:hypothetical protein
MAWTVAMRASSRSADPQGTEQVSSYESLYRVEVLAVDGPAPSRFRLEFIKNVLGFEGGPSPSIIHGKTYTLDARAPHVRDPSDQAAPEAEAKRVLDVFPDLGTRGRFDEVLPDGPMQVGERRDDLAGAVLRIIHPRAWSLRHGSAALARVEGADAVFTLSLDAQSSESGLHLEVSGEARVRMTDARLEELTLAGRYDTPPGSAAVRGTVADPPGIFELKRSVTSEGESRSDR